jgi:hypothetical protein
MENTNNTFMPGYDEFACFHISDFEIGDAILVQTDSGKIRALVSGITHKSSVISYRSRTGSGSCHINDIAFLSGTERGWLSNA